MATIYGALNSISPCNRPWGGIFLLAELGLDMKKASDKKTDKIRDDALRHALSTPPKPKKGKEKRGDPDGGQPLNPSGKERSAKESGGQLLGIGFH